MLWPVTSHSYTVPLILNGVKAQNGHIFFQLVLVLLSAQVSALPLFKTCCEMMTEPISYSSYYFAIKCIFFLMYYNYLWTIIKLYKGTWGCSLFFCLFWAEIQWIILSNLRLQALQAGLEQQVQYPVANLGDTWWELGHSARAEALGSCAWHLTCTLFHVYNFPSNNIREIGRRGKAARCVCWTWHSNCT